MKATGRPSKFSSNIAEAICLRIASGESLRAICTENEMPDKSTVLRWLAVHSTFRDQYAHARDAQADTLVEECLEIADDSSNDYMLRTHGDDPENVAWQLNSEHVQRSRLRIDTRKWWAARIAPKKYGDKVTTEVTGPNDGPIQVNSEAKLDVSGLTIEQIRALASIKVPA